MIILYKSYGAGDFELLSPKYKQPELKKLLFNAKRLLSSRDHPDAATILSQIDFNLWNATNNFNDEFCVLRAEVPIDKYESINKQYDNNKEIFTHIAEIFDEIGIFIRFIVCDLKLSDAPNTKSSRMPVSDIYKLVNDYIGGQGGYLGDFTYRTHREFYPQYCDLDINPYEQTGTTRERFIDILQNSEANVQAKIVRGILKKYPVGSATKRTHELFNHFNGVAMMLEGNTLVQNPDPVVMSNILRQTLDDAEALLRERGATSCIDRVHTALHSYLLAVCDKAEIEYEPDANITRLFKILRNKHPSLATLGSRSDDIEKILKAFASILDALNPIRNRASVAHPNEELLDNDEAVLVINATRTLLHYLDSKFSFF